MPAAKSWLETLTLDKLSRLATQIGTPCSGTKPMRLDGIRRALLGTKDNKNDGNNLEELSLLSIDMGIRNLAFAHVTTTVNRTRGPHTPLQYGKPQLQAWRRIAVSESLRDLGQIPGTKDNTSASPTSAEDQPAAAFKESFEPVDYARHAYSLIKYLLQTYQPNQIIIERQRFRSGGGSAVQEWTIRVGVFEGMLYSVLRTLMEEGKMNLRVDPMLPNRVNRFWLEDGTARLPTAKTKLTGREVKKAKIELVASLLQDSNASIHIAQELEPSVAEFVSSCKKASLGKRTASASNSKLDDLADSLLQGLAFIHWQNNREYIKVFGQDAIDMETGAIVTLDADD